MAYPPHCLSAIFGRKGSTKNSNTRSVVAFLIYTTYILYVLVFPSSNLPAAWRIVHYVLCIAHCLVYLSG